MRLCYLQFNSCCAAKVLRCCLCANNKLSSGCHGELLAKPPAGSSVVKNCVSFCVLCDLLRPFMGQRTRHGAAGFSRNRTQRSQDCRRGFIH